MTLAGAGLLDRFGVRLGLILTLALAPVGIIALVQSAGIGTEVRARTEAALSGETLRAAAMPLARITDAQGMARGLAAAAADLSPAACDALLRGVAAPGGSYLFAARVGADGRQLCGTPDVAGDLAAVASAFQGARRSLLRVVRTGGPADPPAPDADVLVAVAPVFQGGVEQGFVAVAPAGGSTLPAQNADEPRPGAAAGDGALPARAPPARALPDGVLALVLFDRQGDILSVNVPDGTLAGLMPREDSLSDMAARGAGLFAAPSAGGPPLLYSVSTLVPGQIYALGAWPDRRGLFGTPQRLSPLLLPAAAWAACLLAAWIAAELMVTRHMRRFRRAITAFAGGNRRINPLRLARAPAEIREAAEAFEHLTETILKDEAELENSVREKEALLREVHHRVKNNLQLMASIINLQLRRTRSDEAKTVMRRLQDRMLSLATIHNSLFHTASLTELRVDPLFAGIVDQIIVSGAGAGRRFDITAEFQPMVMSPEQVVPLALLLTEALGRAMKTAVAADHGLPPISVRLTQDEAGPVTLMVRNTLAPEGEEDDQDRDDDALGNQLIHAFALQLDGIYRREILGAMQVQELTFSVSPRSGLPMSPVPQG